MPSNAGIHIVGVGSREPHSTSPGFTFAYRTKLQMDQNCGCQKDDEKWIKDLRPERVQRRRRRSLRNGYDGNGIGAGTFSEAEEGIGIQDWLAWSLVLPQHPLFLLHWQHSSIPPQPPIHNRKAFSLYQPRIPRCLRCRPTGDKHFADATTSAFHLLALFWSNFLCASLSWLHF